MSLCVCESESCPCVPGQERYGNMTRVYYREAVGALVVLDVTRASTFNGVLKWKDDLDSKVPQTGDFLFFVLCRFQPC